MKVVCFVLQINHDALGLPDTDASFSRISIFCILKWKFYFVISNSIVVHEMLLVVFCENTYSQICWVGNRLRKGEIDGFVNHKFLGLVADSTTRRK